MVKCDNPITFYKIMTRFIYENKIMFTFYMLLILLYPMQEIGVPHIIGILTKNIEQKKSIYMPLFLLIFITIVIQLCYIISAKIDLVMYPNFQKYIRNLTMDHVMNVANTNFEEIKGATIIYHLQKLPLNLYSFIEDFRDIYIPQALVYVGTVIYFWFKDKTISIALILVLGIILFLSVYTIHTCHDISRHRDRLYNDLTEDTEDVITNLISVLSSGKKEDENKRADKYMEDYFDYSRKTLQCSQNVRYLIIPIVLLFFCWSLYRMYQDVIHNKMKSYVMISLVLILLYVMKSMWVIMYNVKEQVFKWGSIMESIDLLNECGTKKAESNKDDTKTLIIPSNSKNGFLIENVYYGYEGRPPIFKGLNLKIDSNKKTLLVGEIGSGKSTLLKLLLQYKLPIQGEIYYNGRPYSQITPSEIRTIIGYVPQTPILFDRTLYENITYASQREVSYDEIINLMHTFNLKSLLDKFPKGLDTPVGKGGSKLSGGQRQIIWILRVIFQNPEVVLLDEPTSALDEDTKVTVHKMLEYLIKDKTAIMVTHDKFLYKIADEVIELRKGQFYSKKKN